MLFLCRVVARCFFNKTAELVHLLTGCSKQVKEVQPKMFFVNGKLFLRARLFWKRIRKRSNFIENFSCTWLWIQLPARRKLQRHRHKKKASNLYFSAQFPIRQTWSTDRFSFDTLILITRLLFSKQFSKSQLYMAKYKRNLVFRSWESCDS